MSDVDSSASHPSSTQEDDAGTGQMLSSDEYGRQAVGSLGAAERPPVTPWRPGVAGTGPDGSRFVVYARHLRVGGTRAWRTSNPGNLKTGEFARAHGAIGRDGQYAIFPDERTGMRALVLLLGTPRYAHVTIREVLLTHASDLDGHPEADARARQFRLDPNRLLGSLDDRGLVKVTHAIASSHATRLPRIHKLSSSSSAAWAEGVLEQAQTGATASAACYMGDPANWQVGIWYQRQSDGTYAVSPDQNPRAGASGMYARYDGNDAWSVVGRDAPGSGAPGSPNPQDGPDAGNATPPDGPALVYQNTITRDDGTVYTVQVYPPSSSLDVPPNAVVIPNTDGTYTVLYNNDGSEWDPAAGGEAQDGGQGQQGDPGANGEGGDAVPDEGGTGPTP